MNENNPYTSPQSKITNIVDDGSRSSKKPVVLAILGSIFWLLPILGMPIIIYGLVVVIKQRSAGGGYLKSLIVFVIALTLCAANLGIGAYMGATGQHPLVNKMGLNSNN